MKRTLAALLMLTLTVLTLFGVSSFSVFAEEDLSGGATSDTAFDLSGITFEDKTVTYTGEPFGLEIKGELPEGVSVSYDAESYKAPGTYVITATFINDLDNSEITKMTATLRILSYKKDHSYNDSSGRLIARVIAKNNGVLETNTLNFRDVTTQYNYITADEIFGEGKVGYVISAYDIYFAENGIKQAVDDEFEVKFLLPIELRGTEFNKKLIHITGDGRIEELTALTAGDYVACYVTDFSIFAVVDVGDAPVPYVAPDYTWVKVVVTVLVILIIVAIIALIIIKKRKGKDPEEKAPVNAPADPAPKAPAEEAPAEEKPEEAPAEEAPAEEKPEEAPAEEAPAEEKPEEVPAEEAPAEEKPEEALAEEAPAEEKPEEAPAEEAPAEEKPEEAPAEEAPVEEKPEETPVEEKQKAPIPVIAPVADGDVVQVRYRTSFMSRLIQSDAAIQGYYSAVKNALLSYKGVKARTSWNFESFNKGRIQCAKLNVKGSAFQVYLGLEPKEYNANKYHFVDVSDKPKLDQVPMLIKVKSERSLKYALELIEEMMKKLEIEKGAEQNVDYTMPYETTEALAERDLVKIILPAGVTMDGPLNFAKLDVGALIDTANSDKE